MIVRIVQMTFKEAHVPDFTLLFEARKELIRNFEGCLHLELWQDINNPAVFFTCSHWIDESYLENYRCSGLFKDTWEQTKALFAAKANAWSVDQKVIMQ